MKFAFLVSGAALSEGQIEALRHSIEDLAQQYGMDKFAFRLSVQSMLRAVPFMVERVPDYLAFPLEGPETARCGHCGARLTAEQFSEHKCGSPAWPCHALPVEQWCDNRGPGDFMGHTCGPPPEVLKLIEEGAKPARSRLMGPGAFWRRRPPYVVVCGWGILGWLFAGFILLKAFGS